MSASKADLDRLYWSLVVLGPMTSWDLQVWTNWTRSRVNDATHKLRQLGLCELIERNQHHGSPRGMRCGKWKAVTESEIVDALEVAG